MPFPFFVPKRARATASLSGRLLLSLSLVFALADAFADDVPLTLAQARHLAVKRSRQLVAKDYQASSSRDMAVAAGQLPDPVLKVGIDNLPVNGADRFSTTNDFMTMRRVGVMQEITRADKRQLRAERFDKEAEKSLAEKNAVAAAIERDTALAWLDRYYTEAMAKVITEQGTQAKLEIQAAEGAYRASRGSQADVYAARSALASFDDRSSEIERRIRNAKVMLARWIGDVANQPLAGQASIDAISLDPASLDTQLAHHPEIAVLSRQEEIAATEADLAKANKNADWSVEVAYQQRGSAYSNMVSIGVSIPLQWDQKNRQDKELSSKLAMLEQARAEKEDMLRQHVAETRSMINEWQNNRERLSRYASDFVPLAQQRTAATLAAYRGGKAGLMDLLAARRNEIDVRLQALQLEADTARLWAQLNFLVPEAMQNAHMPSHPNQDTQ